MNRAAGLYRAPRLGRGTVFHVSGYMPPDPHPMRSDLELAEDLPVQASVTPLEIRNVMCDLARGDTLSIYSDIYYFATGSNTSSRLICWNDLFTAVKVGDHVMGDALNTSRIAGSTRANIISKKITKMLSTLLSK